MSIWISCSLNAFLCCVVANLILMRYAATIGLIDAPTARKLHTGAVPTIGGIAIFAGFVLALGVSGEAMTGVWNLIMALLILLVTGIKDDSRDMRALTKLGLQCLAALVMILPGSNVVDHIGDKGALALGALALPFTLIFVVGLINALNMLDGVDGLAGGIAVLAFGWMVPFEAMAGQTACMGVVLLLASSSLGFLCFNIRHPWRPRAAIFMGDAGSMVLGAAIAFFSIRIPMQSGGLVPFASILWLMAIPAVDTVSLLVRRGVAGGSPFKADRQHLHHLLLDAGLTPGRTTATILTLSVLLSGIGYLIAVLNGPTHLHLAGLVIVLGLHSWFVWSRQGRTMLSISSARLDRARP